MINIKKRVTIREIIKTIIIFLMILSLILPDYVINYLGSNSVFLDIMISIVTFSIFTILLFLTINKKKYNFFLLLIIIFFVWRTFSSVFLNDGQHLLSRTLRILSLVMIINLGTKENINKILLIFSSVMSFYVIINFISILFMPNGLYLDVGRPAWILGINNQFGFFILPTLVLVYLTSWVRKKRFGIFSLVLLIISLYSVYIVDSMTSFASLIIVSLLLVFVVVRKKNKIIPFSFNIFLISYLAIWITLVLFTSTNLFNDIILFLNRDLTFSGRTYIWSEVLNQIGESLIYGHGLNATVYTSQEFVAHNMILQIILDSGLIGIILFLAILLLAGFKLQKNKHLTVASIVNIGIFGVLIGGLMETYRFNYFFVFLMIGYKIYIFTENYTDPRVNLK